MTKIAAVESLMRAGWVSPEVAIHAVRAFRLADIVYKLKKRGVDIETRTRRNERGESWAEYRIARDTP